MKHKINISSIIVYLSMLECHYAIPIDGNTRISLSGIR